MIVVADTSVITALSQTRAEGLLRRLFGRVVIPEAVRRELLRYHSDLPPWIQTETATNRSMVERLKESLDPGESEAIVLALEHRNSHEEDRRYQFRSASCGSDGIRRRRSSRRISQGRGAQDG